MDPEYLCRLPALKRLILGSVVLGLVLAAVTPAVAQGDQPAAPSPTPIPVGVAYGTPAEKVIELLTEVALAHDEVLEDPEPKTIFTGFGDSSLDFELRAWTQGDFVAIASDLCVGIDTTLASNGIEIPFPQRDLHLRTVDRRAAARLSVDSPEFDADGLSTPTTGSADGDDSGGVTS